MKNEMSWAGQTDTDVVAGASDWVFNRAAWPWPAAIISSAKISLSKLPTLTSRIDSFKNGGRIQADSRSMDQPMSVPCSLPASLSEEQ
ncbi:MAG: hypothetical protein EOP02_28380 [Proteobacteria bacterium]|nr:MAG: hypothetical protein EOP02_28380 [Pseudomonadota bacterium]